MTKFLYLATGTNEEGAIWTYVFSTFEGAREFVSQAEQVTTPDGEALDMVWEVAPFELTTPADALADFTEGVTT